MDSNLIIALGAALVIGGIGAAVVSLLIPETETPATRPKRGSVARLQGWYLGLSRRERIVLAAGVAAGLIVFMVTGWAPFILIFPVAAVLLPSLFTASAERLVMERLEDMEAWTRSLGGLVTSGTTLEIALKGSLRNAGETIAPSVGNLVARLDGGWSTKQALKRLAKDFNDPTGDLIVLNLLLASQQRGGGLIGALEEVAGAVQEEVRIRRQISADRAKTRQNIKVVVVATILMLLAIPLVPALSAGYATPMGQVLYLVWVGIICLILWRMYKNSQPAKQARLMEGAGIA
ncbi:type II secretion system F family protein [Arthrobacter rhombi]|uniref:type II secretion system F family protein n=1 Tax=Arthrobacter rhombi TaxID=71253 RepID=UPI003FD26CAD